MSPMPGYIARLRQLIGHDRLLLPGVSVLVWDSQGRLLLVRQADTATWSTIGGAVEIGESPAQAAIREAREETGLDVELTSVRAAVGGPAYDVVYPNGARCSYVSVVYDARTVGGTLAADGLETTAVRWVAVDELPSLDATSYASSLFRELGLI